MAKQENDYTCRCKRLCGGAPTVLAPKSWKKHKKWRTLDAATGTASHIGGGVIERLRLSPFHKLNSSRQETRPGSTLVTGMMENEKGGSTGERTVVSRFIRF